MTEQVPIRRLLAHTKNHRSTMWLASLFSILNKIFDLAPPLLIGAAVDVVVKQEAHLLNIAVDKNYHRKGIGSILINHLKTQVQAMGINLITLEVRVSNSSAISFYKKHNFMEDAIRANYYSKPKPEDALLMSVRL